MHLLLFVVLAIPMQQNQIVNNVTASDQIPTPAAVTGWVATDIMSLPVESRPFVRYQWLPPWADKEWAGTMSFSVNTAASSANNLVTPDIIANGWVLRWDLRKLAPDPNDLVNLINVWDSLALDEPYFHIPQYNLRLFNINGKQTVNGVKIAAVAPHISPVHSQIIISAMNSPSMVYRADWSLVKMLSTTKGGIYYKLQGFDVNGKRLNQTQILARLGANEEVVKSLNGDARVGIIRSEVTGKPRRVDRIQGVAGRNSTGAIWITHDIFDEDVDVRHNPFYNLLAFFDSGREIIYEKNNGLHGFVLTNNAGALADEAPPNLVSDHRIPAPYTKRLQGPISCIRCHADSDGLKPTPNQVKQILAEGDLDVYDDFGDLRLTREQVIDRLGAFTGDFDRRLALGRNDYSDAVFKSTGGMSIKATSDKVAKIYASLEYTMVTPEQALLELGVKVKDGNGAATFKKLFPRGEQIALIDGHKINLDDPMIGFLRINVPINRLDFERIYADLAIKLYNYSLEN